MQRENNKGAATAIGAHPACAACKHQRKKCDENCILAPYFPAEKSREFQAVHKVFGVGNATKIVRNASNEEDRKKVADSLIWEAFCRQKDPVLGPYGEYKKIYEELTLYKTKQYNQMMLLHLQDHHHQPHPAAIVTAAANTKRLIDVKGSINNVGLCCYNQDIVENSLVVDQFDVGSYGYPINPSQTEKPMQEKGINNTTTIVPLQYYATDVGLINGKALESTKWG
ncbi:hypothetical protein REPUB_Repub20aG0114300 [Reevesia pubescens]